MMMDDSIVDAQFHLAWLANQALARLGLYASGVSALFWGVCLLIGAKTLQRIAGAVLLASGLAIVGLLYFDALALNIAGAQWLYGLQTLWWVVIGVVLLRD